MNLEWAIVKDLADEGAFDEAIKDVDAVAHTASPFNFSFKVGPFQFYSGFFMPVVYLLRFVGWQDNVKDMLEPALKGTTSVLEAAKGEASVKAVVITSS